MSATLFEKSDNKIRSLAVEYGVPNRRGLIYSRECIENAIINNQVVREQLENKALFIIVEKPEEYSMDVPLEDIACAVTSLESTEVGLYVDAEILNTPKGRFLSSLKDNGYKIRIHIRGVGDIDAEGNVYEYSFGCFVCTPDY